MGLKGQYFSRLYPVVYLAHISDLCPINADSKALHRDKEDERKTC